MGSRALLVAAILALSWVLVGVVRYSAGALPSFDGAMNLNTAVSLLSGHGYGFFYDIFFPFPAQTDGPFILPAALAIGLGGVTPFTTQVVNLGYVVVFGALGLVVFRRFGLPLWLAVFGVVLLVATPGFIEYGMNGYGEIPAMVWYLSGLLVLGKTLQEGGEADQWVYRFAAGVLFGLAYLTKVVALILVVPVFVVYFLLLVRRPLGVRNFIPLCAGFVAPVLVWEVFRFIQLGGIVGFRQWWWLQLGQIFSQSGAHLAVDGGWIEKGGAHISALSSLLGLPVGALTLYLIVPLGLALLRTFAAGVPFERRLYLGSMAIAGVLYFAWWLFVTPSSMAWLRRILDGVLIIQCLALIAAWASIQVAIATARMNTGRNLRVWGTLACVLPIMVGQIGLTTKGELTSRLADGQTDSSSFLALAETMAALPPDAVIFGTGWWKAPVLALFSGRQVNNFQRWRASEINALTRKFFVVDAYARQLAQDEVSGALAMMDYKLVIESDAGALYEIVQVRDYAPFAMSDENGSQLQTAMDFSLGDYPFKRGFYAVEDKGVAWMRPDGAVMLRRSEEDRLRISVVVPEKLVGNDTTSTTQLKISAVRCLDETVTLSKAGRQQFEFVLNCPAEDGVKPFPVTLAVNRHLPAVRQIDADNRLLALLVQSVGLYHGLQ